MKHPKFKKTPISLALTGLLFTGFAQEAAGGPNDWDYWADGGPGGSGNNGGGGSGHAGDQSASLHAGFDSSLDGGPGLTPISDMNALAAGFITGIYNGVSDSGSHLINMNVSFGEGIWNGGFESTSKGSFSFSAAGGITGNSFSSGFIFSCECNGGVNGNFFGPNAASAGGNFDVTDGRTNAADSFNIPQTMQEGPGGPQVN